MNKKDAIDWLLKLLEPFEIHERMIKELLKIILRTGYEKRFFEVLITRLKFLEIRGVQSVEHEEFELISEGLFSMHLVGKDFNIRILYSFLSDGTPALLLAFFERSGKRVTDYSTYKKPAMSRLKELEGKYCVQ